MRFHPILLVLVVILAAACGGGDVPAADSAAPTEAAAADPAEPTEMAEPTEDPAAPAEDEPADDAAATVATADTSEGTVLVDGDGLTLYLFTNDNQSDSTCYDDCASTWPPLEGPASAGDGVDESLLGVVERDDGTQQVTYNSWPLYYYQADQAPGDVNGQGVGDVWFAVDAGGDAVAKGDSDEGARDY